MSGFDLAQFDDAFNGAAIPERKGPAPLPDGAYIARIDNIQLKHSKTSPAPVIELELLIHEGEFAKRRLWKNLAITANSLQYVKRDLAIMGFTSKLSDFEDVTKVSFLLDTLLGIGVKKKDNGQEIYINKRVGHLKDSQTAPAVAVSDKPPF